MTAKVNCTGDVRCRDFKNTAVSAMKIGGIMLVQYKATLYERIWRTLLPWATCSLSSSSITRYQHNSWEGNRFEKIKVSVKITVLSSTTLSQSLDLENFASAVHHCRVR